VSNHLCSVGGGERRPPQRLVVVGTDVNQGEVELGAEVVKQGNLTTSTGISETAVLAHVVGGEVEGRHKVEEDVEVAMLTHLSQAIGKATGLKVIDTHTKFTVEEANKVEVTTIAGIEEAPATLPRHCIPSKLPLLCHQLKNREVTSCRCSAKSSHLCRLLQLLTATKPLSEVAQKINSSVETRHSHHHPNRACELLPQEVTHFEENNVTCRGEVSQLLRAVCRRALVARLDHPTAIAPRCRRVNACSKRVADRSHGGEVGGVRGADNVCYLGEEFDGEVVEGGGVCHGG